MMQSRVLCQDIADKPPVFPLLTDDCQTDVVIIGAGITGLIAAYNLMVRGLKVVILERHTVGTGTTGYSTDNLYVPVQPYFQNIIKKFNVEIAQDVTKVRRFAIDSIQNLILKLNIHCHFSWRPWYLYASDNKEVAFLNEETKALQASGITIMAYVLQNLHWVLSIGSWWSL